MTPRRYTIADTSDIQIWIQANYTEGTSQASQKSEGILSHGNEAGPRLLWVAITIVGTMFWEFYGMI